MSGGTGRLAIEALHVLVWGTGAVLTGLFFWLRSSSALPSGDVRVAGLASGVEVVTDSFGIPHVFARGREDLWRAQGFLHGRDRRWQMELFRRIAAGRLSELFGEGALAADRLMRALDLWGAAARALEGLEAEERAALEAYASGVAAGTARGRRAPPPEFVILRFEPEPWSPQATLAVGLVMTLDLSHWRNDLHRHVARAVLPPEKFGHLRLPAEEWGPTILEGPFPLPARGEAPALPGLGPRRPGTEGGPDGPSAETAPAGPQWPVAVGAQGGGFEAFRFLAAHSLRTASNAWVVAPSRAADGRAILANDMHLGLRAPALWYLAGLHAEDAGLHAAGLTLPGVPGVVVGYNRGTAWGFTNGMVDDMDFVVEELGPDGASYRLGDGWARVAVRPETIRVRGRPEPEVLRVRETARGPIVSDVLAGLGADLSAVWVAARPTWSTLGIPAMNAAEEFEEFDRALIRFGAPHQNVVFASVPGRIGYRLSGTIPLRDGWDGTLPVDRKRFEARGLAVWPREGHPAAADPASGFFATANNLQAPNLHGVIGADYPPPFRALRLARLLAEHPSWTAEGTMELQRDTRSLLADRVLDRAIRAARAAGAEPEARLLEAWDRRVSVESRAAPILYAWLYRLRALVAADEFAAAPGWGFYPLAGLLRTLERGDADPWVDDMRTPERETLEELSVRAMRDVLPRTAGRTWGDLHLELHRHPLGDVAWLDRLLGFHVGPYPGPGGPHTVRPDDDERWAPLDSTSWSPPWRSAYGPSERFVAQVGPDGVEGRFLLPTGQSGNPFSPHYRDMHPRWRDDGPLISVPLDGHAARARGVRRFRLVPAAERSAPESR